MTITMVVSKEVYLHAMKSGIQGLAAQLLIGTAKKVIHILRCTASGVMLSFLFLSKIFDYLQLYFKLFLY